MRLIKYTKQSNLCNTEYITLGVTYTLNSLNGESVYLRRHEPGNPCPSGTFMRTSKLRRLLQEGALIFVD